MSTAKVEMPANIPNRFLFVWTGRAFPYTNRLAVESALLADPDAEIEIHIFDDGPDPTEHFEVVGQYERVSIKTVDLDRSFTGLTAPAEDYRALMRVIPRRAYHARSNLIRYALLHSRGGVFLEFDVLVVRSFRHLLHCPAFIGEESVWRYYDSRSEGRIEPWMAIPSMTYMVDLGLRWLDARILGGRGLVEPVTKRLEPTWSTPKVTNAVIGAMPGNAYIRRVLDAALDSTPLSRHHFGRTLVSRVYEQNPEYVVLLPPEVFFVQPPSFSFRFFHGKSFSLPADTVLIHYISSNHGRLLKEITPSVLQARKNDALFFELAHDVATRARDLPRRS